MRNGSSTVSMQNESETQIHTYPEYHKRHLQEWLLGVVIIIREGGVAAVK